MSRIKCMVMSMGAHQIGNSDLLQEYINRFPNVMPRYERKFRLRSNDGNISISSILNMGFNVSYDERYVNSIYYDTHDYRFALENINGERYRVKPRLRWYGESAVNNDMCVALEYKFRDGFIGYKYNKKILLNNAAHEIENDLFFLVNPVVQIGYVRKYFLHSSGIRATVDTELVSRCLFEGNGVDAISIDYDVLEFKYPLHLDQYFRECMYGDLNIMLPFRLNKSSKYVEGFSVCQSLSG